MAIERKYPRGSEWRQWDLHIHTPASFHWKGARLSPSCDTAADKALIDAMIVALNEAEPAVFAIQDYWGFEGWFALKRRLAEADAPALEKTVFPGIELRIAAPMKGRLNAHVIFSNDIPDQYLKDFLSGLRLEITDQPLSPDALRAYARRANADKLKTHSFDKTDVEQDDEIALRAGSMIAELKVDSYKQAVAAVPGGMAVGFMPFETNDGLASVQPMEHYAYAIGLFNSSPIFETRDEGLWNAFVGRQNAKNEQYFTAFQEAIAGVPRLPVSGSDAHQCKGVPGDNDKRGYGDFPSGKITWIKADPTWRGLLQAIKEPGKRCHIGKAPPKLERIANNKTFYIDSISITKAAGSTLADTWFDGCTIPLNADLVAIIGNKGSGKSALADVLALVGNSQEHAYFSFLRPDRFRGKAGEPARQFQGTLSWLAGTPTTANLADNPDMDRVELVRYVPQGRFEALCNEHVTGKTDNFERELRTLIFSHIASEERLGALDFNQLIEARESSLRAHFGEQRKILAGLNTRIAAIEAQLHPAIRKNLEEQISLKDSQLLELSLLKPAPVAPPAETLTGEQEAAAAKLEAIAATNTLLTEEEKTIHAAIAHASEQRRAILHVREALQLVQAQVAASSSGMALHLETLGLQVSDVLVLDVKEDKLPALQAAAEEANTAGMKRLEVIHQIKLKNDQDSIAARDTLNGPQRVYQEHLVAMKSWENNVNKVVGTADAPDSKMGLEARLQQLNELPAALATQRQKRTEVTGQIYDLLAKQRDIRSELFAPLQKVINENLLTRDDYRLQFRSHLAAYHDVVSEKLFSLVKQSIGELRGEDESRAAIKARVEAHDLDSRDGVLAFTEDLHQMLHDAARQRSANQSDLDALMRKDRTANEVYDFIFSLDYLGPKYTLLFQDTQIEQLSPGQRGALLLIFYLLVDKRRHPIILDQPEENLDNETIVSLLVPVLNAAKENRQIIMVTHNPNLAVVCDAEQIIFAEFDRKALCNITYLSGAIEDPALNTAVVNVLEGTKPAFDNRGKKYQ